MSLKLNIIMVRICIKELPLLLQLSISKGRINQINEIYGVNYYKNKITENIAFRKFNVKESNGSNNPLEKKVYQGRQKKNVALNINNGQLLYRSNNHNKLSNKTKIWYSIIKLNCFPKL